ncbi:hypothetical protein ACSBR2_007213 [Camellia fascicularis]
MYTKNDLESSIALVSLASNDSAAYLQQHNGTLQVRGAHEIGGSYRHFHGAMKHFVFGDSYSKSFAGLWKEPYGITFPGRSPAGSPMVVS